MLNILELMKEQCSVSQRVVTPYETIRGKGMTFSLNAYEAVGLGRFSILKMKAMFGLMKMDTIVFTPTHKDMPLFSYDRIYVMGKETLILELYDTCISMPNVTTLEQLKDSCRNLPDYPMESRWYDNIQHAVITKKGKKLGAEFDRIEQQYFKEYLTLLFQTTDCDKAEKMARTQNYVDGLLNNGGPSTEAFYKLIGQESTAELYNKYVFASQD